MGARDPDSSPFAFMEHASRFFTRPSQPAVNSPPLRAANDPSEIRVASNCRMAWVEHDDLEVFMHAVRAKGVGVEHLQVRILSPGPLLGYELNALFRHQLSNAHSLRPSSMPGPDLSPSPLPHADPNHDDPLFRLVANGSSPVQPRWFFHPHYRQPPSPIPHAPALELSGLGCPPCFFKVFIHEIHLATICETISTAPLNPPYQDYPIPSIA